MKSMLCSTRVRRQVGGASRCRCHFLSFLETFPRAVLIFTCVEEVSLVLISFFWGGRDG